MELAELAAILGASGRSTSLPGSQPNSLETGLGIEATRNPIAALYYQAERGDRVNQTLSPEAMRAIQLRQQQEYELERLKAIAGPAATIAGHSQAAVPGALSALGIPLNEELFGLEQMLNTLTTRSNVVGELGGAAQSAAAGGYDLNDILSQLDFGPVNRTTPTSVQVAQTNAAAPRSSGSDGTQFTYNTYTPGGVQTQVRTSTPLSEDQLATLLNQPAVPGMEAPPATTTNIPPNIMARFNRVGPSLDVRPTGNIEINGTDNQGRPIYVQRVVRPNGEPDYLVTGYGPDGNPRTSLLSRMSGGG